MTTPNDMAKMDSDCPFCESAIQGSLLRHSKVCPEWPKNPTGVDVILIQKWFRMAENRKIFQRQHYEILAARFREEFTLLLEDYDKWEQAIGELAHFSRVLADRFKKDNEEFDADIWYQKVSPDNDILRIDRYSIVYEGPIE